MGPEGKGRNLILFQAAKKGQLPGKAQVSCLLQKTSAPGLQNSGLKSPTYLNKDHVVREDCCINPFLGYPRCGNWAPTGHERCREGFLGRGAPLPVTATVLGLLLLFLRKVVPDILAG